MSATATTLADLVAQRREQAQRRRSPRRQLQQAGRFARWHVPEGVEREPDSWLLTYLDMLTLLLALLVVLLGLSRMGWPMGGDAAPVLVGSVAGRGLPAYEGPYASFDAPHIPAEWARLALPGELPPAHPADVGPLPRAQTLALAAAARAAEAAPPDAPMVPLIQPPSAEELGLADLGDAVDVVINEQSISFRISNELLFPSGQATLSPAGLDVVQRLAKVVGRSTHPLSVEGHSDPVPIQTRQFPSNWELSTSRATSVLRQLVRDGVDAGRLRAVGYADTRPIASNDTAEGRAANRRVELIMEISPQAGENRRKDPAA